MTAQHDLDLVTDIVIPTIIILGLFLVNGVIFAFIMRERKKLELHDELAELMECNGKAGPDGPSTSNAHIEMQHL